MNIKPKSLPAIEDDERHRDDVDGFLTRNRDALNASIRRARKEVAEGNVSSKTIDDIINEGRRARDGRRDLPVTVRCPTR